MKKSFAYKNQMFKYQNQRFFESKKVSIILFFIVSSLYMKHAVVYQYTVINVMFPLVGLLLFGRVGFTMC